MASQLLTGPVSNSVSSETTRRLSTSEFRRRIWHMAPGLLPFVFAAFPRTEPISLRARVTVIAVAATIAAALLRDSENIARTSSENLRSNVLGYLIPVVSLLFLLPTAPELGMTVLAVLAFGDGSATVGGLLLRGQSLPWNRDKSWAGLVSFLVFAAPLAFLAFYANASPTPELTRAAIITGAAAVAGAIAETLPLKMNDNVSVGAAATVTVLTIHFIF